MLKSAEADYRRKAITTNENLARTFQQHGLDTFVYLEPNLVKITPRLRADAMEAILGAVGKDGSMGDVRAVMGRLGLLVVPAVAA